MNAKQVTAVIEGSGREMPIEVKPDTSVETILQELGLSPKGSCMEAPDGGRLLSPKENLFSMVKPGDKLSVSPMMDAG